MPALSLWNFVPVVSFGGIPWAFGVLKSRAPLPMGSVWGQAVKVLHGAGFPVSCTVSCFTFVALGLGCWGFCVIFVSGVSGFIPQVRSRAAIGQRFSFWS